METLSYFFRYLSAAGAALLLVVALSLVTRFLPRFVGAYALSEPFELLGYSIMVSGPFVFAAAFLTAFFGTELMRAENSWARALLVLSLLLLCVAIISHFIFLPRR